mmetsp:Transcript_2275/g.4211  ORF Transcript_2275/g.4211 Transcript_2275/m.4211 type:complete len:84 (+) Transcript_2275:3556-3807(+)
MNIRRSGFGSIQPRSKNSQRTTMMIYVLRTSSNSKVERILSGGIHESRIGIKLQLEFQVVENRHEYYYSRVVMKKDAYQTTSN